MCTRRFTSGAVTRLCEFPEKTRTCALFRSEGMIYCVVMLINWPPMYCTRSCILFTWGIRYPNRDHCTNIASPAFGFLRALQCENRQNQYSPQGKTSQPGGSLFLASQGFLEWPEFPLPWWSSYTMSKIVRPCCNILFYAYILAQHPLSNTSV